MQNAEMVGAIVDGQGDGLAAAYDRYAPALYGYCRSLLGEPAAGGPGQTVTIRLAVLAPLRVFTSHLALNPGPQTVIVRYPPAR